MIQRHKRDHTIKKAFIICTFVGVLLGGLYCYKAINKPLPPIKAIHTFKQVNGKQPHIDWPAGGQSAIGSIAEGTLAASSQNESSQPMASIAKVITALVILDKYPLNGDEPGPAITMTQQDVESYNYYVAIGGSHTRVEVGEVLSERQMLDALLLPSANNIADSLARWAYGSQDAYKVTANAMIKTWGLKKTYVDDSSGLSSNTVSTATELVLIGQRALKNPVLARIVNTQQSIIPVAGTITNVNRLLGVGGIIGIKTGNTDEAGGCLLFAATHTIATGHTVTIIGAVQGMANLDTAFTVSQSLLAVSRNYFVAISPIHQADIIGRMQVPWGQTVDTIAAATSPLYGWQGNKMKPTIVYKKLVPPLAAQTVVGTIRYSLGDTNVTTDIVTATAVRNPSYWWKLTHYF